MTDADRCDNHDGDLGGSDGNSAQSGMVFRSPRTHTDRARRTVEGNVHPGRPSRSEQPVIPIRGSRPTRDMPGTLEVVCRRRFFLGASASARLQVVTPELPDRSMRSTSNTDGYQSYSIGLAPEFRPHLNKYADLVSNNSVDYVWYNRNDQNAGSDSRPVRPISERASAAAASYPVKLACRCPCAKTTYVRRSPTSYLPDSATAHSGPAPNGGHGLRDERRNKPVEHGTGVTFGMGTV